MVRTAYIEFIKCVGCEACVELCPGIFRMNEDTGRAEIIPESMAENSMQDSGINGDNTEECIQRAINICPADCIHWNE
jgi:ferredoxin